MMTYKTHKLIIVTISLIVTISMFLISSSSASSNLRHILNKTKYFLYFKIMLGFSLNVRKTGNKLTGKKRCGKFLNRQNLIKFKFS